MNSDQTMSIPTVPITKRILTAINFRSIQAQVVRRFVRITSEHAWTSTEMIQGAVKIVWGFTMLSPTINSGDLLGHFFAWADTTVIRILGATIAAQGLWELWANFIPEGRRSRLAAAFSGLCIVAIMVGSYIFSAIVMHRSLWIPYTAFYVGLVVAQIGIIHRLAGKRDPDGNDSSNDEAGTSG